MFLSAFYIFLKFQLPTFSYSLSLSLSLSLRIVLMSIITRSQLRVRRNCHLRNTGESTLSQLSTATMRFVDYCISAFFGIMYGVSYSYSSSIKLLTEVL